MQGKIIKGISGFYYIHVAGSGIYECKAKGVFRNQNIKPLVGDNVEKFKTPPMGAFFISAVSRSSSPIGTGFHPRPARDYRRPRGVAAAL